MKWKNEMIILHGQRLVPKFNADLKNDLITAEIDCKTVLETGFQVALRKEVGVHGTTSDCLSSEVY